jgi:hypothetical protein
VVLSAAGLESDVEELEGDYSSPTVLVNGVDVTGRPIGLEPLCRLDLPTEKQLREALRLSAGVAQRRSGENG